MKKLYIAAACTMLAFAAGCGMDGPVPSNSKPADETTKPQVTDAPANDSAPHAAASKPDSVAREEAKPRMTTEKAHVGMGEKGHGYGNDMITLPVRVLWQTKERIALLQIEHDLELYNGTEGHYPKTHEEFMEKIVKENSIKLPELPAGQTYVYDPEDHLLKIRKPRDPDGP